MGIYNPNAEMPKNCAVCKEDCKYRNITAHKRHKRCPLIEIKKPHGRLVDIDKTMKIVASGIQLDVGELSELTTIIGAEIE